MRQPPRRRAKILARAAKPGQGLNEFSPWFALLRAVAGPGVQVWRMNITPSIHRMNLQIEGWLDVTVKSAITSSNNHTISRQAIYVAAIPPPPANLSFRWTPCCRWEPPSSNISTGTSTSTWIWSTCTSRHKAKARRSHHLKWRVLLVHCSRNRRAEGAVGVETEAEMWR